MQYSLYFISLINFILCTIATPKFTIFGTSCNLLLGIIFLIAGLIVSVRTHLKKYYRNKLK